MVAATAIYELPASLRVAASCLGKRFAVTVGHQPATLVTPAIVWADDRPSIVAPTSRVLDQSLLIHMAEAGKEGWERWETWGSVSQWNPEKRVAMHVRIGSVLLELTLDSKGMAYSDYLYGRGHPTGPQVDRLFATIDEWFQDLRTWIEVAVDQDINPAHPITHVSVLGSGLQLVTVEDATTSLPARAHMVNVFGDSSEEVNLRTFLKILAKLRASEVPSDAHLLLRDARADLRRGRYRKAVIDAGSAVELTLADVNRRGPNVNTGSRPTLGWFVDQPAVAAAAALPASTKGDLVGLRNDAIHKNVVPSRVGAANAIALAKAIVDGADPLGLR